MANGVKIVFRDGDRVLALRDGDDLSLPSRRVPDPEDGEVTGTDVRVCANGLFKDLTRKPGDDALSPLYRGRDDEYGISSSYLAEFSGWRKLPKGHEWADPRDVLLGRWGLFARDAFNALGLMNRPRLSLEKVYRISQRAIHNRESVTEAIDMVIDEVALLLDIGKPWAVDAILREVDVRRLHGDVIAALQSVVEDVPDLPSKPAFNTSAAAQIAEIDKLRTKIRFGSFGDVRAAAAKIYRQKGKEFGEALRAGELSKQFPYMKHIAEAEARVREEGAPDGAPLHGGSRPQVPFDAWPESARRAALATSGPRVDAVPRENPKDPRGVTLEEPRPRRVLTPLPEAQDTPAARTFRDELSRALDEAPGPTPITFDDDSCPSCGVEGQAGKFCSQCGHRMLRRCAGCSRTLSEADRFCSECGTPAAAN